MLFFILPAVVLFAVSFTITYILLEKRKINKHKKNLNYEPQSSNEIEEETENTNQLGGKDG